MESTYQKIGVSEKEYSDILYGRQTWVSAQIVPAAFSEGDQVMIEERAGKYFEPTGQSFVAEILGVCEPDEDNEFLRPGHKILSLRLERHGLDRQKVKEAVYEAIGNAIPGSDFAARDAVVDALDPFLSGAEILVSLDAELKRYFEAEKETARLWAAYEADPSEHLEEWAEANIRQERAKRNLRIAVMGWE